MLLPTNEFKNWHFCINVDPLAVGSIASSEIVHIYKKLIATKACEYKVMF